MVILWYEEETKERQNQTVFSKAEGPRAQYQDTWSHLLDIVPLYQGCGDKLLLVTDIMIMVHKHSWVVGRRMAIESSAALHMHNQGSQYSDEHKATATQAPHGCVMVPSPKVVRLPMLLVFAIHDPGLEMAHIPSFFVVSDPAWRVDLQLFQELQLGVERRRNAANGVLQLGVVKLLKELCHCDDVLRRQSGAHVDCPLHLEVDHLHPNSVRHTRRTKAASTNLHPIVLEFLRLPFVSFCRPEKTTHNGSQEENVPLQTHSANSINKPRRFHRKTRHSSACRRVEKDFTRTRQQLKLQARSWEPKKNDRFDPAGSEVTLADLTTYNRWHHPTLPTKCNHVIDSGTGIRNGNEATRRKTVKTGQSPMKF